MGKTKKVLLLAQSNAVRRRVVNILKGTGCCEVIVVDSIKGIRAAFFRLQLEGKNCGQAIPDLVVLDGSRGDDRVVSFLRWLREVEHWSRPVLFLTPQNYSSLGLGRFNCTVAQPIEWVVPACELLGLMQR